MNDEEEEEKEEEKYHWLSSIKNRIRL